MPAHLRRALCAALATASATALLAAGAAPAGAAPSGNARSDQAARPANDSAGSAKTKGRGRHDVVLFVKGEAPAVRKAVEDAKGAGAAKRHDLSRYGGVSVGMSAGKAAAVERRLARHEGVTVTRLAERTLMHVPNDTLWAGQAGYLGDIDAPEAWDLTHGSASVRVAVVDSGVRTSHPDLVGKVAGSYNAVDGTSDVTDELGHGTMVAGMAVAATNNGVGIAGTGYDSKLLAVKVMDQFRRMHTDDVAAGVMWAAQRGADVINLSLGGSTTDAVETKAIADAQALGAVVVASAGNETTSVPQYPAAHAGVIAVGATDSGTGSRAGFSNFGSWVDVAAPGVGIGSTTNDNGYRAGDGTSFSAPLVAGAVALVAARAPGAPVAKLAEAVVSTAAPLPGQEVGGLLDMDAALRHLLPTTQPTITTPTTVSGLQQLSATSTAPMVQFLLNGSPLGAPVATSAGSATKQLDTWGLPASGTLGAADCNGFACGDVVTQAITVDNPAPTLTAPTTGQTIGGAVTLTASAPAGGVRFLVGGVVKGFDGTAPYELPLNASTLPDGGRTITVQGCNAAGTVCQGPTSSTDVTVATLRPTIVRATSPFSPNGDKKVDTTTWVLRLPDTEHVSYVIRDKAGTVVRGPVAVGPKGKGDHTFTWGGRSTNGARLPNGDYTIGVSTTAAGLKGYAARVVRLDTAAPGVSGVVGANGSVYPVRDGFRDAVKLGLNVSESATANVRVSNSSGRVVRSLWASRSGPGVLAVNWNGRNASGTAVPAGTYTFRFFVHDAAQNKRATVTYKLVVSWKRLVAKSTTLYQYAMDASDGGSYGECAAAGLEGAVVWLVNECDGVESTGFARLEYTFTLPAATTYTSFRLETDGRADSATTQITGSVWNTKRSWRSAAPKAPGTARGWAPGPTWPAADNWQPGTRKARLGVTLFENPSGAGAVYQMFKVRLVVSYKVLA